MAVSGSLVLLSDHSAGRRQHDLHVRLAAGNSLRFTPMLPDERAGGSLVQDAQLRIEEERFVEGERNEARQLVQEVPSEPEAFVRWFEALRDIGPGQGDSLFPWLAEYSSLEQMRWFLGQEVAGEAGFDDLVALTQLKMPVRAKLEMARNYWDEMGQGRASAMHGPMLERLAGGLAVHLPASETIWQSLALGNLMVALAWNRHYAYQAVGALGAIELTAPTRARFVSAGLRRLGVKPDLRKYFAVHATLDVKHAAAWNAEVLFTLLAEAPTERRPAIAAAMAEGALMRLLAGARCFEAYRQRSCLPAPPERDVTTSRATATALRRWR